MNIQDAVLLADNTRRVRRPNWEPAIFITRLPDAVSGNIVVVGLETKTRWLHGEETERVILIKSNIDHKTGKIMDTTEEETRRPSTQRVVSEMRNVGALPWIPSFLDLVASDYELMD